MRNLLFNRKTKCLKVFKKSIIKIIYCLLFVSFLFPNKGASQDYNKIYYKQRNQILAYNLLLNGFIGGIGGAINKNEDEKLLKAFGKNFLKGALGGVIKYTAKYETYHMRLGQNAFLAKPNRLMYFLGHSFVNNASLNRSLLKHYNFQIFGVDLNFDFEGEFSLQTRASVATIFSLGVMFGQGHHLDIPKSLEYGNFFFNWNEKRDYQSGGFTLHNCFVLKKDRQNEMEAHEINHIYQQFDYCIISNLFNTSFKKFKSKKVVQTFNKYFYLEVPYFALLYSTQPKPAHFRNFFEFEAEHFNRRWYVPRYW